MKSKERHELKQNELEVWLKNKAEQIGPYSRLISLVALLTVLLVVAGIWWFRQSAAREAAAWNVLYMGLSSGSPAELEGLAHQYSGTRVSDWALVSAADIHLSRGCRELFENKSLARDELRKATELYRTLQNRSSLPEVLERAAFGLGRAYEAQGELDRAREAYQQVIDRSPDGAYAAAARKRLDDIERDPTKAFYDKFAAWDPKPAEPAAPGDSQPAFDPNSLQESSFPGLVDSLPSDDPAPDESPAMPDATAPIQDEPTPMTDETAPPAEPETADPAEPETSEPAETDAAQPGPPAEPSGEESTPQ
jgi:tetratricopeptide (TPR) repeat protein